MGMVIELPPVDSVTEVPAPNTNTQEAILFTLHDILESLATIAELQRESVDLLREIRDRTRR